MTDLEIISYLKNYVDSHYPQDEKTKDVNFNDIVGLFLIDLRKINNKNFEKLLLSVFIPDLYMENGSKEKLFTKLVEVIFANWCERMNFKSEIITQKSGIEDVRFTFQSDNKETIVVDTKSFRLGRSQLAPNVKDFLKLESVKHWIDNCNKEEYNAVGGLITYTSSHEWKRESEVYIQCSTKETPTLMLSYEILAYLLHYKDKYNTNNLINLWDFNNLFNIPVKTRKDYWDKIIPEIIKNTNTSKIEFDNFIKNFSIPFIQKCVDWEVSLLEDIIKSTKQDIKTETSNLTFEELQSEYIDYRIHNETSEIFKLIDRINKFRR